MISRGLVNNEPGGEIDLKGGLAKKTTQSPFPQYFEIQ